MLQADLEEAERYSQFEQAQMEEVLRASNPNRGAQAPIQFSGQDPSVLNARELLASHDHQVAELLAKSFGESASTVARDYPKLSEREPPNELWIENSRGSCKNWMIVGNMM